MKTSKRVTTSGATLNFSELTMYKDRVTVRRIDVVTDADGIEQEQVSAPLRGTPVTVGSGRLTRRKEFVLDPTEVSGEETTYLIETTFPPQPAYDLDLDSTDLTYERLSEEFLKRDLQDAHVYYRNLDILSLIDDHLVALDVNVLSEGVITGTPCQSEVLENGQIRVSPATSPGNFHGVLRDAGKMAVVPGSIVNAGLSDDLIKNKLLTISAQSTFVETDTTDLAVAYGLGNGYVRLMLPQNLKLYPALDAE